MKVIITKYPVIGISGDVSMHFDIGSKYTISDTDNSDDEYKFRVCGNLGYSYWLRADCYELCDDYEESSEETIAIKYFEGARKLKSIDKGDWIDLYSNAAMFIPEGKSALIPLGVAMKLPEGYEAIVAPRSSTFKNWGLIQTNSVGVIDNSYCGNNDEWKLPVYCLEGKHVDSDITKGTWIEKGDKICQFRIVKNQPQIMFNTVEELHSPDRGGFGSTGKV